MAPALETLRKKLHFAVRRLAFRLEAPTDALERIQFQPAATSAVRIAQDAGWLSRLRDGRVHAACDLVEAGQDMELLIRIMRILVAARTVDEVGESQYKANKTTMFLCEDGVRAGMAHWFDNMAPVFVNMPAYFRENNYQEPLSQDTGPYHHLFGLNYWQRLSKEPHLYQDLNTYMQAHKKAGSALASIYPMERLTRGFDSSQGKALLIDVGGGKGHQLVDLAKQFPDLPGELVLQDLEGVLPDATAQDSMAAHGISCMAHNFFTPQPIKGARCYYFSAIFHDWPDEACAEILGNTVSAMIPGYSKLVMNGIILPPTKASYFEACKDYGMMAAMSAKERTRRQLDELAARVGLRVVKVFPGLKGHDFVMELELVRKVERSRSLVDWVSFSHAMQDVEKVDASSDPFRSQWTFPTLADKVKARKHSIYT